MTQHPVRTILVKECKILYYAFFRWKWKERGEQIPLHKNSAYFFLFLALLHEQIIEMIIFHIYLKSEEPSIANIFTALHLYSILYLIGDYNWVRNSPIRVEGERIEMKIGARRELVFCTDDIERIQKTSIRYGKNGGMIHEKHVFHATAFPRVLTHIFGISAEVKYEIIFKEPLFAAGYFGTKKQVKKAFLYLEQSENLAEFLMQRTKHPENKPLPSSASY
ncbi:hypothetical protein GKZ89_18645 [Bacillus mangrovi]|uniref:Uncharacterized protein n=1 Tax=Metabacillus mangrovi TaxID=1491830 RepID=A0A7X2S8F9_9BACI|nr:hypothetical protein [Metabacillus mangrovi]MTH55415.1 hypothetical protein [Metabacillus mangrovi]